MKREEWERIFAQTFCQSECPRTHTDAAKFIREAHPQYHTDKAFTEQSIVKVILSQAWTTRRKEQERIVTRKFLSENLGERQEQRAAISIGFLNSAQLLQSYIQTAMASVETVKEEVNGRMVRRYRNPVEASLVLDRASKVIERAQRIGRIALGYEDPATPGDIESIWDNVIEVEFNED